MIITDSIFLKGSSHQICQDYALHTEDSAVGSDGCSGSPNTDVGARVLSHIAISNLNRYKKNTEQIRYSANDAALGIELLNLPKEALDATLFGFKVIDNEVFCFICGDGYVYKKYKAGDSSFTSISFEPNMPFYPSYFTDLKRLDQYRKENPTVTLQTNYFDDEGDFEASYPAVDFCRFDAEELKEIECLLIFSDGLGTFQLNKSTLPLDDVVKSITNFKSYSPGFIQRKVLNGIKKDFKGELTHWDDLSVIGLANL